MGGFGGWGASVLNDSTALERYSGSITFTEGRGAGNAIRDDDLKQLFDSLQFLRYEYAHKQFIKGDNRETVGVILGLPTIILTLVAVTHRAEDDPELSKKLYAISGALAVPTITYYVWGRVTKGKAKRSIDKLVDEYNAELELRQAAKLLQFEFEPTVFLPNSQSPALGLTVSLNF